MGIGASVLHFSEKIFSVTLWFSCVHSLSDREVRRHWISQTISLACSGSFIMAKRLLFVILIYFPCKTQCEDLSPQLTVDPPVISAETHSVILNCQPPSSAPVSQCYFIIEGRQFIESYSCWKTLTLTELLAKTGQSSPAEVKVQCFYTVRNGHAYSHSSYSNMASIYIQNLAPQLTVYPPVISAETHSVTLNCQPPSSAPVALCYFIIEGGESVQSSSCGKTLTLTELLVKTGQSSPAEVKVKCFYTVRKGDVYVPSSHSNMASIYIQSPVEAAPTLTVNTQNISETESVTLRCQPPPSVSAPQCYFYIVKGGSPKLLSCVKTLTGSELLLMSQQSSPAEVEVKCFYTVKLGHVDYPSAHSDAQVMMIQSGPPELSAHHSPGRDVVFACSLPGSVIKDTTCNLYFGDGTVQRAKLSSRSRMDNTWFCKFSASVNDLLRLSPQQSHASCDYSLKGDPNTLSPRSERYNLADIVEKESRRAPAQPSLTQTTSKTSSTAKVQWTTSSPTTSVKDIVESQSTTAPSQPSLTQTTSKTSSTVQVQWTPPLLTPSVTNIVEKESSRTSTQPSLTQTTSKTSSTVQGHWRTSSPHTLLKDNIIKIIAGVTLFGVAVGVNFLGWLFIKKESCFNKRTRGNVSNDSIDMEVVDSRRVVPAGKNQSIDAMVPNEVYCSDTKEVDKNSQDNEGEYHVYQTINDVPDQRIQNDMVYSLLQAH